MNKRKHIEHAHDAYIDSFFFSGDIFVKNLLVCTLVGLSAVGIKGSFKFLAIGLLLIVTIPAEGNDVSSDSLKIASDDLKDISETFPDIGTQTSVGNLIGVLPYIDNRELLV
jgi:hypothetical protein